MISAMKTEEKIMEWITALKQTLKYIEDNLENEIDINELAEKIYISPFYLQKGFSMVTGFSIGEYIRSRRLYEAAQVISKTDERIIDVALRFGYETPESFTKAFGRFHGASPNAVRRDSSLIRCFLPLGIRIEITGGEKMDYTVSPMWGFKLIGFERIFSEETSYREIPEFWDEICEKYCLNKLFAGKSPSCPEERAIVENCIGEYAVCIDDVGGGKFRYIIAGKYTGGEVPEGMSIFELPGGEWAKFNCVGRMPEALQKVNAYIFKEWLPDNREYEMSGCYNIEWYSGDGKKNDADYKSAIWIPVKKLSDEARERWGDTAAFKECEKKSAGRSSEQNELINDGLMKIFTRFGAVKEKGAASAEARSLVSELQSYINNNFYACSDEMLGCLGEMYVGDERFKKNIDRSAGEGTAEFVSNAIKNAIS